MLGRVGTGSWREVREEAAEAGAWDTDVAVKAGHRRRRGGGGHGWRGPLVASQESPLGSLHLLFPLSSELQWPLLSLQGEKMEQDALCHHSGPSSRHPGPLSSLPKPAAGSGHTSRDVVGTGVCVSVCERQRKTECECV